MQEPTNELQFAFNLSRNDYYRGLLILQLAPKIIQLSSFYTDTVTPCRHSTAQLIRHHFIGPIRAQINR